MNSPLHGLKILELANVLAGPAVGQFFAELGAEVLKVEAPGGDVTRSWRLPNEQPKEGRSAYFCAANWGKSSRVIDLRTDEGKLELQPLLAEADVLLTSYKAGDAARFGIDAENLRMQHPRLIIGEISGYGANDLRVGYDAIVQAEAGFTYLNGNNTTDYHKMPVALVDLLAAHQLKQGLLLALWQRDRSGEGTVVRVNLLDAALAALANQATNYLVGGVVPQPMGSEHPNIVPYGSIYQTADGVGVVLAVGTDKQFASLLEVLNIDLPETWRTNAQRVQVRSAVNAALAEKMADWQADAFLAACYERHIPAGRVNTMPEAMALAEKRGMLLEGDGLKGLRTAVFAHKSDIQEPPALC
jgi:crotonobetainyl-CoA:carnitine CoA-transferase CaiB-like acyl-CoA transferase